MLDRLLVLIAFGALIAFCAVVIAFVPEPDLTIAIVLILALAAHDFWIAVFRPQQPTKVEPDGRLEAAPTGVSGKPVTRRAEEKTTQPKRARKAPAKAARSAPARSSE